LSSPLCGWTRSAHWPSVSDCWAPKEIILIHHTDCGMQTCTDDGFKKSIEDEVGIRPVLYVATAS
jgi:hypothetical protein